MMRIAIHQPNYQPWCGYLAKMAHCDVFVFLDDAQMPGGQSYVYRTQLRHKDGPFWLSLPTQRTLGCSICDVGFGDDKWPSKHLKTIQTYYGRAPHFPEIRALLEPIYLSAGKSLAEFNIQLLKAIAHYLEMDCRFVRSSDLMPQGMADDRLIDLCRKLGGSVYLSGKGGQNYQDPDKFAHAGIALEVRSYRPIPYPQLHGNPFIGGLSILDALCNLGRDSRSLLRYVPSEVE